MSNPLNTLLDDVDLITFGREFQRMLELATERGLIMRGIGNFAQGVRIMWRDVTDCEITNDSDYAPTLQAAIRAEIKRFEAMD